VTVDAPPPPPHADKDKRKNPMIKISFISAPLNQ